MRARSSMVLLVCIVHTGGGCTCRKDREPPPPVANGGANDAGSSDLELRRDTLVAFGNAIPLPVSAQLDEEIPAVRPALERASKAHPGTLTMRVARDVPFGQLTRLMQAAIAYRVLKWELVDGDKHVVLSAPGALPAHRCFARVWISPDGVAHVGWDPGGDAASMTGVVVRPKDGAPQHGKILDVVRRLDGDCKEGQLRLYTQASAPVGPLVDLAVAATASPPKVSTLMAGVPSLGPLDAPTEVVP